MGLRAQGQRPWGRSGVGALQGGKGLWCEQSCMQAAPGPRWVSDYSEAQAGRLPEGPAALASPDHREQQLDLMLPRPLPN